MEIKNLFDRYKIELTGLGSWAFFTCAAVKFSAIYSHILLVRLSTYSICSIFFLLYFFSFYRSRFEPKKFIILLFCYNFIVQITLLLYSYLFILRPLEFNIPLLVIELLLNLVLLACIYLIVRVIIKRRRN
jgi:RsiW-degrading membrane proteinase PrsW (M82 family)